MNKGSVVIISGPSGSGKDTILRSLFKKHPEISFSISATTRPMREEDKKEKKYDFISKETFEQMIKDGMLLEYNCYVSNYYGTPKKPVVDAVCLGKDIFIEVDVNGAANIKKQLPEAISIFIMPPSFEELRRRLSARGSDDEDVVAARLNTALEEIKRAKEYDYIVVNEDVEKAVEDIVTVLKASKMNIKNQMHIIGEVLEKC